MSPKSPLHDALFGHVRPEPWRPSVASTLITLACALAVLWAVVLVADRSRACDLKGGVLVQGALPMTYVCAEVVP